MVHRKELTSRRKLLMRIFAVLFVILAVEGAARVIKTIHDDVVAGEDDWYVYASDVGWRPRPGGAHITPRVRRRFDERSFLVEDTAKLARPRARPRVVGIGDSTMYGYDVEGRDTYMAGLGERFPGVDFINLAVPAYTACNGSCRLVSDGLPLEPSLILASFSFNDRRYVLRPDEMDSPERFASLARRQALEAVTGRIYVLRGLMFGLEKAGLVPRGPGGLEDYARSGAVDLATLKPRVEPDAYRQYLTRIVQTARGRNIPLVFIMTGDNPDWMLPIREALARGKAGDAKAEIGLLQQAVQARNALTPLARLELARVLEAAGNAEAARDVRTDPYPFNSVLGGYPIYRDDQYQQILSDVAARNAVPLVDARLLDRPDVFMDFCHFNAQGHGLVADLVARALVEKRLIPRPSQ